MRWLAGAAGLIVAGSGGSLSGAAFAGQLSFAPSVALSADNDSNRNLTPEGFASQSSTLQLSANLSGSTEATEFSLTPLLTYQYFDSSAFENIFERDVSLSDVWTLERGKLTVTAEDGDHSTITTEPTETGLLSSRLHQRQEQGALSLSYDETERLSLIASGSYADVSYYGAPNSFLLNLLSGYRNPSASIGEQLQVSETSTLLTNVSYSKTLSQLSFLDSQDIGVDLEYHQSFTERFDVAATIGASQASAERTQNVTTGSLSLTRKFELGSASLNYTRSLSPYGTGALVERQVLALTASRDLSDQLSVNLTASRVNNNQLGVQTLPSQLPEIQTYNTVHLQLTWRFAEFWHLNAEVDATQSQPGAGQQSAHEWRTSLSVGWSPQPLTTQF